MWRPDYVKEAINRIAESGNLYGAKECRVHLADMPEKAERWYGWVKQPGIQRRKPPKRCSTFWEKAGVAFAVLHDEPASGCAMGDLMGWVEEVRTQARKAGEAIRATGANAWWFWTATTRR